MSSVIKAAAGKRDITHDWSRELPSGDTISASVWVMPEGISKDSDAFSTTTTTVWVSGGTAGQRYRLVNRVTTSGGRIYERPLFVDIEDVA